jgi:hypothetical protein
VVRMLIWILDKLAKLGKIAGLGDESKGVMVNPHEHMPFIYPLD